MLAEQKEESKSIPKIKSLGKFLVEIVGRTLLFPLYYSASRGGKKQPTSIFVLCFFSSCQYNDLGKS